MKKITATYEQICPNCGQEEKVEIKASKKQMKALVIIYKYHYAIGEISGSTLHRTGILEAKVWATKDELFNRNKKASYEITKEGLISKTEYPTK